MDIKNKRGTPFVANMLRDVTYNDLRCRGTTFRFEKRVTLPNGTVGTQRVVTYVPGSITWQPGETLKDLPVAIASIPEVADAILRRDLVVVK